ncbi:MAG: hypothetical protein HKP58_15830, partial [Desulfatitalea sp.]|nr:hypothetical protein [Desulfatitalea sp.]NNK01881.1 hypothetical protein [Desulfatitalea sp.]
MKNKYVRLSTIGLAALLILAAGICPAGAFEAKVSGQVNHLFMYADDGTEENFLIGDNDNSSTRFRFTGEENFGMVKAGFTMEMEMESNTSSSMTIDQQDDGATTSLKERILEGYFNTPYGKISIGQGDGAANGTSEVDLSGTTVINYSDTLATAGSFSFRTSGGGTGPTVSETRNNFDGLSRNDRIRYDSPTIAGFFLSTSMTNGEAWEIA